MILVFYDAIVSDEVTAKCGRHELKQMIPNAAATGLRVTAHILSPIFLFVIVTFVFSSMSVSLIPSPDND